MTSADLFVADFPDGGTHWYYMSRSFFTETAMMFVRGEAFFGLLLVMITIAISTTGEKNAQYKHKVN